MEGKDIRELRVLCLRKMRDFRRERRPIFYTDETYINSSHTVSNEWIDDSHQGLRRPISKGKRFIIVHAGGEAGFVNNGLFIFKSGHRSGDYHDDMNYKNYSRCMETQLIPNLPLRSVVVMDNASYHNVVAIKHSTANINKREMLAWLDERGIYYGENPTKPLLYSLIRKYKPDYINYSTDAVFSRYGHTVCRLPPYHPELNPIEIIWSHVIQWVGARNVTFSLNFPSLPLTCLKDAIALPRIVFSERVYYFY